MKLSMSPTPKISVVVPAYNEDALILECLEALATQTIRPFEVIVVDNNSTDNTADIVRRFGGVKLIKEKEQGIMHARNTGFNFASGDIVVRTDADSRPASDWLESVAEHFANNDSAVITGRLEFSDVVGLNALTRIEAAIRRHLFFSKKMPKFLLGANMAIRRDVWAKVWSNTCSESSFHEDIDLTIHMQDAGYKLSFEPRMVVSTSARRMSTSFIDYYRYVKKIEKTYNSHNISGTRVKLTVLLYVPFQPIIRIARRTYCLRRYKTADYRLSTDQLKV